MLYSLLYQWHNTKKYINTYAQSTIYINPVLIESRRKRFYTEHVPTLITVFHNGVKITRDGQNIKIINNIPPS